MTDGLEQVRDALRTFAADRDWFQYHNPKNLTMALSSEVGELSALYQWLTPAEAVETASSDHPQRPEVEDELADVFVYLIRLADELHVDLVAAALSKIEKNEARFPTTSP
jgi:NTP pyrophosphatase (non-canonical NTP hydrolase)